MRVIIPLDLSPSWADMHPIKFAQFQTIYLADRLGTKSEQIENKVGLHGHGQGLESFGVRPSAPPWLPTSPEREPRMKMPSSSSRNIRETFLANECGAWAHAHNIEPPND